MQESNMHLTSSSLKFVNTVKNLSACKKKGITDLGFGGLKSQRRVKEDR